MRKIEIQYPTGYPFVLFQTDKEFVVAVSKVQAKKTSDTKTSPRVVKIDSLIKRFGYSETHKFLRGFSDHWLVKNGQVFFKAVNTYIR